MKFFLVYKFTFASFSSGYIGETFRHFNSRIEEPTKKNNKSHIFKHLHSSETCFDSYNSLCFNIIDKASSKFDLKIKQALHINWRKLKCTIAQSPFHYSVCSVAACSFLSLFVFLLFFAFHFHLLYFYCLWR